jgi:Tol biopolymer transport system component
MSFGRGTRLGPYEVSALIGEGGMGQVYRATDTNLKRQVAIKVLPESLAADPEHLARFQREAEVLAALNHPNIAHIYGVEKSPGTLALVMELVDGPTLADQIANGPIPLDDTLPLAKQIAEALEAAHEQGIIHRDLKPANIKVRPDGAVKVLDFGLAKAIARTPQSDLTHSPTASFGGTRVGMLLGTAPYMSPEQARGTPVDKRTDIWAFGCVLYEMMTGHRAFSGPTTSDTVAAILEREPNWGQLPAATPVALRRLLRRCLAKETNNRLRDIGEARVELGDIVGAHDVRGRSLAMASIVLLGVVAVGFWIRATAVPRPVTLASEYVQLTNVTDAALAPSLSGDGRLLTFKRGTDSFLGAGQVYVKVLPNGDAVRLTDDLHSKYGPVFTPDDARIAYTQLTGAGPSLSWDTWTVSVLGGPPARLLPNASGLVWLPNHRILFSEITSGLHMQIVSATESRAEPHLVYSPALENGMAHYSSPSPDSRSALIVEMGKTHTFDSSCRLVPLDGSSPGRVVGPDGKCYSAAWSPDGRWMYFAANVGGHSHLWRQTVPNGAPEQITFGTTDEEGIAIAPDGRSVITSVGRRLSAIWLHDSSGDHPVTSEGYASDPLWSGDGAVVFYRDSGTATESNQIGPAPSGGLRAVNLKTGQTSTIFPGVSVTSFDVSPDARDVVYTTGEHSESQIWIAPVNRSASPRLLARSADQPSFAGVGVIVFRDTSTNQNFLTRINVDGSGRDRVWPSPIVEKRGVSPDGEMVAAVVPLAKGDARLADPLAVPYDTMAIPVSGGTTTKLCNGSCLVTWSLDGRFLYVGTAQTVVLSIPPGRSLPVLPAAGISVGDVQNDVRGAQHIAEGRVVSRSGPSTYLFTRVELHANLFRIPLH